MFPTPVLSLQKPIAERHGAREKADSQRGSGSSIRVPTAHACSPEFMTFASTAQG